MPAARRAPSYDPAAFPDFDHGHVLPPKVPARLQSMPEVRSSLSNAIYMASQIELAQGSIHLRVEPVRAAYFRAALAELVRVEDVCRIHGRALALKQSSDPLLHTIKLLRNYEVHVGAFKLSPGAVPARWRDLEGAYESIIVTNLSAAELRKLDSASGYTDAQLEELLHLFNVHQRKLGVVQLLYNTALHVASQFGEA
jgi:hypothetical protein